MPSLPCKLIDFNLKMNIPDKPARFHVDILKTVWTQIVNFKLFLNWLLYAHRHVWLQGVKNHETFPSGFRSCCAKYDWGGMTTNGVYSIFLVINPLFSSPWGAIELLIPLWSENEYTWQWQTCKGLTLIS